jgi:hypothetical protein
MGVVMGKINCDWFSFYGDMYCVWVCLIIVCGCLYVLIYWSMMFCRCKRLLHCCQWAHIILHGQFTLYSVVGFLVFSLLLLFIISMVVLCFTVFGFLLCFNFVGPVMICCLVALLHCVVLNGPTGRNALGHRRLLNDRMINKLKECGRKWSWSNFRYYPDIWMISK